MRHITKALLAASALSGVAFADPMDPAQRGMAHHFSAEVNAEFQLLADSDDPNLVFYVPRRGGIAVQAPLSESPIPRFQVFSRTAMFGFWTGEDLSHVGGSFSTTANFGALQKLTSEATAKGLRLSPAPVQNATTTFLSSALVLEGSRLQVQCTTEELTITKPDGTSKSIKVPTCKAKHDPDAGYDLDTNVMYKFAALPALEGGVAAQDIPFQAVTLPYWGPTLQSLMTTGAQWDNVLTGAIDWKIKSNRKTRRARATIKWSQVFEQASVFANLHLNSCVDIELNAFFRRLATCSDPERCGVKMEYLDDSDPANPRWSIVAPSDADFIEKANSFQAEIQKDLFNEVATYSQTQLGPVSRKQTGSVFTLRANYEKLSLDRNETREFSWNPGSTLTKARTTLNISCLKGGYGERVSWDMENQGCRTLVGH